jgi:hypothetical protein
MPINEIYEAGVTRITARFFKRPTGERALLQDLCRGVSLNDWDKLLPDDRAGFATHAMKLVNQPLHDARQVSARIEPLHRDADNDRKLSFCGPQEIRFAVLV